MAEKPVVSARRLSIRPSRYRGEEGFTLQGERVNIFDRDRAVLEAIREVYRQIADTELAAETADLILTRKVPAEHWEQASILASANRLDKMAAASPSVMVQSFIAGAAEEIRKRHAAIVWFLHEAPSVVGETTVSNTS